VACIAPARLIDADGSGAEIGAACLCCVSPMTRWWPHAAVIEQIADGLPEDLTPYPSGREGGSTQGSPSPRRERDGEGLCRIANCALNALEIALTSLLRSEGPTKSTFGEDAEADADERVGHVEGGPVIAAPVHYEEVGHLPRTRSTRLPTRADLAGRRGEGQ